MHGCTTHLLAVICKALFSCQSTFAVWFMEVWLRHKCLRIQPVPDGRHCIDTASISHHLEKDIKGSLAVDGGLKLRCDREHAAHLAAPHASVDCAFTYCP